MMPVPEQFSSFHYCPLFRLGFYVFNTHLLIFLEMVKIPIWSIALYVRPQKICHFIFHRIVKGESRDERGGSNRKGRQACVFVHLDLTQSNPWLPFDSRGGVAKLQHKVRDTDVGHVYSWRPFKETEPVNLEHKQPPYSALSFTYSERGIDWSREWCRIPLSSSPSLVFFLGHIPSFILQREKVEDFYEMVWKKFVSP